MSKQNEPKAQGQVGGKFEPAPKAESVVPAEATERQLEAKAGDIHDKLYAYPPGPPDGWLQHLVALLRGRVPLDPKHDLHFAWHVAGWAASKMDPHDDRTMMFGVGAQGVTTAADNLEHHPDDPKVIHAACRQLTFNCDERVQQA